MNADHAQVSDIVVTAAFWGQARFQTAANQDATRSTGQVIGNRVCAVFSLLFILIPLAVTAVFRSRTQMRQYVRSRVEVYEKRAKEAQQGHSGPVLPRLAAGDESGLFEGSGLIGAVSGALPNVALDLASPG